MRIGSLSGGLPFSKKQQPSSPPHPQEVVQNPFQLNNVPSGWRPPEHFGQEPSAHPNGAKHPRPH